MADIDRFDQKIISVLAEEGRISVTALADRIGLSKSPTQARLRRLEDGGVIRGYRAMFDAQQLGRDYVTFAEVKLKETTEETLKEFSNAISRLEEIEDCYLIAGDFDYLLKVRTRGMAAYRDLLTTTISRLPHVGQVVSHIAMQAVKEDGETAVPHRPCNA